MSFEKPTTERIALRIWLKIPQHGWMCEQWFRLSRRVNNFVLVETIVKVVSSHMHLLGTLQDCASLCTSTLD